VQFKGRFGYSFKSGKSKPNKISIGRGIGIYDEEIFEKVSSAFDAVMNDPELVLNMIKVDSISINGGLLLKGFFDEFYHKYNKKPNIKGPKNKKMRAVLKYLKIKNYQDVKVENYQDIMCWQVLSYDHTQDDIDFGKLLATEIIPKCWKGSHTISKHSSNIATSISETIYNCKEHAYTGAKNDSTFKQWYLGVGEYPDDTHRFSFCIYDKGIGIKARLKSNPSGWFEDFFDSTRSDSSMIELATRGKRVITEDGRGQGLKNAIELLAKNNGEIDIFSDRGFYSSHNRNSGTDRKPRLEGTMVSFSFPVEYSKESV
jgi:hypothetical protein